MNVRRRVLILAGGLPSLGWSLPGFPQLKSHLPIVGVLTLGTGITGSGGITPFREELAARGWNTGAQFAIEEVHVGSQYDRLPALAEALAIKNPSVIVAATSAAVAAAGKASPRTPVIMLIVADPVAGGFAKSLARPGGMFTGISNLSVDTVVKFVELLIAAAPTKKRIGFLIDGRVPAAVLAPMQDAIRRSRAQYAIAVSMVEVKQREEIEPGLAQLAKQGVQALAILPSPLPTTAREEILEFSTAHRWPVIAISRQWVDGGALLCYGADGESQWRRAAYYVDRILRGAKPGDLPIELPTTFEMGVNLKTAKALGITLPPEIMVRATRVVQ